MRGVRGAPCVDCCLRPSSPGLQIVQSPPELNVAADYGMIVLKDAPMPATLLAHGFGRGNGVRH